MSASNQMTSYVLVGVAVLALAGPHQVRAQATEQAAPDRTVQLLTGTEQRLATDYAVGNTAIGNQGVCVIEILPGRRELLLIARGVGQTTLTLWDQRGRKQEEVLIDVSPRELNKLQSDLGALLAPYPGVRAEPLGDRIVLSGTVASQDALAAVQNIAEAAGVASVVTLGGSLRFNEGNRPGGAAPAGSPGMGAPGPQPVAPQSLLPADAALPVALTSGGAEARPGTPEPAAPVSMLSGSALADDDGPPPAAAQSPPPPNVFYVPANGRSDSLGFGSGLSSGGASTSGSPGSSAVPPPGATGSGGGRVEYRIELYQQSALAPPPEVMGPQGTRIFGTTVTAFQGRAARELLVADPGGRTSDGGTRGMSGLSIEVTPTIAGSTISTTMTVDTNLPIGLRDRPGPHPWRRAQLQFDVQAGTTRYVTEQELASLMSGAGSQSPAFAGAAGGGGGPGFGGAVAAVGDAAGQIGVAAGVQGAQAVPAIGGLFRLGGGGGGGGGSGRQEEDDQPKDDRRLVIVVSAVLGASR